ncbi:MAG TPA: preprotein translocase subunit SecA [Clostridiales bacterium]|nr:preprotein translocase subunit SecA [Clostridiales bacterium]HPU67796.1 preprotein translocase subunit SecA [Clostridiales bacterium]HQA04870.1 preprotein translocase subunit SecA [Clostridiales bacterium]HQD71893.1 preprotein translocase subunit SecA [Clostridiales bacterium]
MSILKKIFGDYSQKELKRIKPLCDKILALESTYEKLTDAELRAKTEEFKKRYQNGESLDALLPEAFAVCREASWRVLGMKHFPVQVLGGIILHQGRIAEMKTGEGKTLVATLPAYLNAIAGEGVHIVTVNDYLARRDSEWMGKVFRFLGLTVGLVIPSIPHDQKAAAYAADITYGTNNEFGFDYLRDNMVMYKEQRVQRGHNFAIVDEVDSILIDEARTPLIISGRADKSTDLYKIADNFVKGLKCVKVTELSSKKNAEDELEEEGDYIVDEKARTATLTKSGVAKAEKFFSLENLMDAENLTIQHHINLAIKARGVMQRDVDYVVKDGQVLIVDEFTGRIMIGRRYSEGLHQAIEAKEGVNVRHESRTLATITFQNYFRLYKKLSGMTGTAMTERQEFEEIYNLDVVEIPTNKPMIRIDHPDVLFKTEEAKFNAAIDQIVACHEKGQPVLVGTVSIEKSEKFSKALKRRGIKHEVLNAKNHEREAEIIAQAGRLGAVTIATNMAGRGTDIILGGNCEYMAKAEMRKMGIPEELIAESTSFAETDDEEILKARQIFKELEAKFKEQQAAEAEAVRKAGGLFIIGTERHESRRIDNQLRGRAGRQGDPGESRFYLSAEDDLLRLFAGDRFYRTLDMFKSAGEMPIDAKIFSSAIESAQKKVEGNNFAIRRNLLKYDDVMNQQREIIYKQRNMVLDGVDLDATIQKMIEESIRSAVDFYCAKNIPSEDWNLDGLRSKYAWLLKNKEDVNSDMSHDEVYETLLNLAMERFNHQKALYGEELMRALEHKILLENVDIRWMEHIDAMEQLKTGIGLRAYAQKDPVVAFRQESFDMFEEMTENIRDGTVQMLLTAVVRTEKDTERQQQAEITSQSGGDGSDKQRPVKKKESEKVGRNDPCPCGSGLKYKKCCGR